MQTLQSQNADLKARVAQLEAELARQQTGAADAACLQEENAQLRADQHRQQQELRLLRNELHTNGMC